VYVSGQGIAVFARDRRTGALRQLAGPAGCVREDRAQGCATARVAASPVAVSPDGSSVYAGGATSGIGAFRRDRRTGALSELPGEAGCIKPADQAQDGCMTGRGLGVGQAYVYGFAVSGDGRNVYTTSVALGGGAAALARFDRDLTTGALTQPAGADACFTNRETNGEAGCALLRSVGRPIPAALSPDGRSIYVGSGPSGETGDDDIPGAVAVLRRDPPSGALAQPPGRDGCLSLLQGFEGESRECASTHAVFRANDVTVSPDSRTVYIASPFGLGGGGRVGAFARNQRTGLLSELRGRAVCVGRSGTCTRARAITAPRNIAVSPDGRNAYVAAQYDLTEPNPTVIASFRRAR
jgi:DNA-binding beta-propeller fold protein YncE